MKQIHHLSALPALLAAITIVSCGGSGGDAAKHPNGANADTATMGHDSATGAHAVAGTTHTAAPALTEGELLAILWSDASYEIMLAKMALESGGHAEVRAYAEMVIDDDTTLCNEIDALTSRLRIETGQPEDDADMTLKSVLRESLAGARGAEFDGMYVGYGATGNRRLLDLIDGTRVTNEEIAVLVGRARAMARKHLERATAIGERMSGSR